MTSRLLRCALSHALASLYVTAALSAPAIAQELLPAGAFRTIGEFGLEAWPADLNRDGITDVVHNERDGSSRIVVSIGNGDGTFRAPIVSTTEGAPIAVGDLNGDRFIDVVARSGSRIVVLPGTGTGALGSARTITDDFGPQFAAVADMNNDGFRDVVLDALVMPGNGDFTFQAAIDMFNGMAPTGGIVVDLTRATFVDSSVLGALLDARRRALESNQGFVVCVGDTVEPGVQRILDITGLVPVLPVVRRRDEAIEAARSNGTAG